MSVDFVKGFLQVDEEKVAFRAFAGRRNCFPLCVHGRSEVGQFFEELYDVVVCRFSGLEASLHGVDEVLVQRFIFETLVKDLPKDFIDLREDRDRPDPSMGRVFGVFFREGHESGSVDVGWEAAFGEPVVEGGRKFSY